MRDITTITEKKIAALREVLFNVMSEHKDYVQLDDDFQRPWFSSSEEAYTEMIALLNDIESLPDYLRFHYKLKFFTYNVEQFFMCETTDHKLFWFITRPKYYSEVAPNLDNLTFYTDYRRIKQHQNRTK